MSKTLCIYHGPSCADGLGAAWAIHRALGPDVEFVAAKYGDEPPKGHVFDMSVKYPALVGRDVLIVDFSYPLPVLRAMAAEARSVLVLDHHKTAQEDLTEILYEASYGDWKCDVANDVNHVGTLAAIFDPGRSGAGLTWDYLHPGTTRPRIIDLIEDRDLWRFAHGDETRAFHAVLMSYNIADLPAMFERLDYWHTISDVAQNPVPGYASLGQAWRNLLDEGHAILRANAQDIASAVAASRRTIKIAGHVVPCANVPGSMASDAGHLLCLYPNLEQMGQEALCAFSATYYDGPDRRHFSLRSPEGGADVGQIAKQMAERFNAPWIEEHMAATHDMGHGTYFSEPCPECIQLRATLIGPWSSGGHTHAAGFDAPLGWEGE